LISNIPTSSPAGIPAGGGAGRNCRIFPYIYIYMKGVYKGYFRSKTFWQILSKIQKMVEYIKVIMWWLIPCRGLVG